METVGDKLDIASYINMGREGTRAFKSQLRQQGKGNQKVPIYLSNNNQRNFPEALVKRKRVDGYKISQMKLVCEDFKCLKK